MDKRGSALLIVLGVMAFVTASVVSFAVYMRESRLPSSYFRRAMGERQFVKAALAHAIDEIDAAIGDDPFPGVGYNAEKNVPDGAQWGSDVWKGRVLMPYGVCEWTNTQTVLTLEALGYLPPCILNEVRWAARHTTNAVWKSFNYDLGRYAFVAVNVSDFLDVNRLRASTNRTVLTPISLQPFAMKPGTLDQEYYGVNAFDQYLNRRGNEQSGVPFVSVMDLNLTYRNSDIARLKHASPFLNMITEYTGSSDSWYANIADSSTETSNVIVRQTFVTDSWLPKTNATWTIDLANPAEQPFAGFSWFPGDDPGVVSLQHCYDVPASHPFWGKYNDTFPIVATALLADYLDWDSVPISLGMPCCEMAPMVSTVEMTMRNFNFRIGVKKTKVEQQGPVSDDEKQAEIYEYEHRLCVTVEPEVLANCVFPFRRGIDRLKSKTYTAQCMVKLFFTETSGDAWCGQDGRGLRIPYNQADARRICPAETPAFTWPSKSEAGRGGDNPPPCVTFISDKAEIKIPDDGVTPDEKSCMLEDVSFSFSPAAYSTGMNPAKGQGFLLATYQYDETNDKYVSPVDGDGNLTDDVYKNDALRVYKGDWTFAKFGDQGKFRPSLAVWVRISDSEGATVDLVPAVVQYDSINGFKNNDTQMPGVWRTCSQDMEERPLLRFFGGPEFEFSLDRTELLTQAATMTAAVADTLDQKSYYCSDPRYNYAPEDWVAFNAQNSPQDPAEAWTALAHALLDDGTVGRDKDPFMFVSNQGYLQSVWELMFVPRTRGFTTGGYEWGAFEDRNNFDGKVRAYSGAANPKADDLAAAAKSLADSDLMWREYLPENFGGEDDFLSLKMHDATDDEAFRMNPFGTKHLSIYPIANTPYDWCAASTNRANLCNVAERRFKSDQFASWKNGLKHCFTPSSDDDDSKWTYDDTLHTGYFFSDMFQNAAANDVANGGSGRISWQGVYDGLDWEGDDKAIQNADASPTDPLSIFGDSLSFSDRKFLYGFWRNCWNVRQQLFLVFVRADMSTISIMDRSRRGTRAMALVWRDPAIPVPKKGSKTFQTMSSLYLHKNGSAGRPETWRTYERNGPPHRTRILFYHQFD